MPIFTTNDDNALWTADVVKQLRDAYANSDDGSLRQVAIIDEDEREFAIWAVAQGHLRWDPTDPSGKRLTLPADSDEFAPVTVEKIWEDWQKTR